ncbi:hypothetical protein B7494_g8622 [Chlorociboria aeruginascens]|nr:hypothetical protein B7494_g8622 [Chlorociboria aeruginascens]
MGSLPPSSSCLDPFIHSPPDLDLLKGAYSQLRISAVFSSPSPAVSFLTAIRIPPSHLAPNPAPAPALLGFEAYRSGTGDPSIGRHRTHIHTPGRSKACALALALAVILVRTLSGIQGQAAPPASDHIIIIPSHPIPSHIKSRIPRISHLAHCASHSRKPTCRDNLKREQQQQRGGPSPSHSHSATLPLCHSNLQQKVKCDESKPFCGRCVRLKIECTWQELPASNFNALTLRASRGAASSAAALSNTLSLPGNTPSIPRETFVLEFPHVPRNCMPYISHFITFCSRFIAYSQDAQGNPFEEFLVPQAVTNPALLNAMVALAAGHMERSLAVERHGVLAQRHYALALKELGEMLGDPVKAKSEAALGACLLLCVYEISHSERHLWLKHLQGARDIIMFRGGPSSDFLTRFFSLLDISGSLCTGQPPLIPGNYWLEPLPYPSPSPSTSQALSPSRSNWPYYDPNGIMTDHFHSLMVFMAKISTLSSDSLSPVLLVSNPESIRTRAAYIKTALLGWWSACPPTLRDQPTAWRRLPREAKLSVAETLEEEALSSVKCCMLGCIIYLHHIIDPLGLEGKGKELNESMKDAMKVILEIAEETPEGYGLEMGLYFGLFMVGTTIFRDKGMEEVVRRKLRRDEMRTRVSVYRPGVTRDVVETAA